MSHAERIAEFLLSIGAVELNTESPFRWTSGIRSPIYCDNRMLYSHPEARACIVDAFVKRVQNLHIPPDAVAGTATAGIGWGALVADRLNLPFVYVRNETKGHGTRKLVEGDIKKGCHVVVVEDLLSTGRSAISAVQALRRECESIVTDVIAIFSYELLSSREMAEESNVILHPLATLSALLQVAVRDGRILEGEVDMIEKFVEEPKEWAAKVGVV